MLQACERPLVVDVRREGESLLIGAAQIATQYPRRLFGDLGKDPTAGAHMRAHYRRDYDPGRVSFGMLHRVRVCEDAEPATAYRSLRSVDPVSLVTLPPDLIDAAVRLQTAHMVLDGTYCFLETNPGPLIASIRYKDAVPYVDWHPFPNGVVPAGTSFLVFTHP